uniref:Neural proliferation, differentiation and control 1 n=1 Tax=Apteryx owenii TaxID=8824 RepID=A0A8B9S386_APTOW
WDQPSPPPSWGSGALSGKEPGACLTPLLHLTCFLPLSTVESCPRSLDCTLQRRELCPPGSHACGPCLQQFVEDDHGRCVQKKHSPSGTDGPLGLSGEHLGVLARGTRAGGGRGSAHRSAGRRAIRAATGLTPAVPLCRPSSAGLIVVCTVAGISALIVAAVCWCRPCPGEGWWLARAPRSRLPLLSSQPGDKTLAQSAQMYHYQHQKQQMLSMEKHKEEPKLPDSASSDEENEDGDFTVYECPGLAPTGEMEVRNPLFDDSTLHPSNPKLPQ